MKFKPSSYLLEHSLNILRYFMTSSSLFIKE